MKILISAIAGLALTACDNNNQYRNVAQPVQQYAQPVPQYEPQYVQPAQPQTVIVHEQSSSGLGSFAAGAAAGALAGHLLTKDANKPTPSYSYNRESLPSTPAIASTQVTPNPRLPAPTEKKNYMDMEKLSTSAKQQVAPTVPASKTGAMDMNKLQSTAASVSKPATKTSSMNMSKMNSFGRR